MYKYSVTSKIRKISLLFLTIILSVCLAAEIQAQKSADLTHADQRAIVKAILEEQFKNTKGATTVKISKQNLPAELLNNFPQIKNLTVQFVPESSSNAPACPYQIKFHEMDKDKNVSVSFGNCDEGLVFRYKKVRGKWKSIPYVIRK